MKQEEGNLGPLVLSVNTKTWSQMLKNDPLHKIKKRRLDIFDSLEAPVCEGEFNGILQMREEMIKLGSEDQEFDYKRGLQLVHLLLKFATAIADNDAIVAFENLTQLYRKVSLKGDSIQRVAAYFADGLAARLLTKESPSFEYIMKEPTPRDEFMAFIELYRISPLYQFAHFTANQAILEAFEGEQNNEVLHVVDFDLSHGLQWPSLIQSLSQIKNNTRPATLKIIGLCKTMEELDETEQRLANFAKSCGLDFVFDGLLQSSRPSDIRVGKNETIAVNLMFYLQTLNSTLDILELIKSISKLNPSILVVVENEAARNSRTFLSRFMESLHYFAALFDMLNDFMPSRSFERLSIEKNFLGKQIKRAMNCENESNFRHEKLETWKGRMERCGFRGINLSDRCLSQAKLLLQIKCHCSQLVDMGAGKGGFKVFEREGGRGLYL
ncbi:hypothetical protein AMTRI_Chr11g155200 [Amborella trichopoda]